MEGDAGGGSVGTASDLMGLLMVIIGAGFDSNYMIVAQYTQPTIHACVCASLLGEIYTKLLLGC